MLMYLQSFRPHRERRFPGKERNPVLKAYVPLQTHAQKNGLDMAPKELNTAAECRHELSQAEYPALGSGKPGSLDYHQSNHSLWEDFHANTSSCPSEKLDFASSGLQMTWAGPLPKRVNPLDYATLHHQGSALTPAPSTMQDSEPLSTSHKAR